MCPQIAGVETMAIGATGVNVIAGKLFERIGARPARIRVYACNIEAVPIVDVLATAYVGSEVIAQDIPLAVDTGGLKTSDHQIAAGVALPGDQLILAITNNNAATRDIQYLVDISPM